MLWSIQTYKLASSRTGPGLFCSRDELTLGGFPLLEKTPRGFKPRPLDDLQRVFNAAYGSETSIDAESRFQGLQCIAHALDVGDVSRAAILGLMLRLPDIDASGMLRLCRISKAGITKYSEDEPRDSHGRWTTDGQGVNGSRAKPPANSSITGRIQTTAFHLTSRPPDIHGNDQNIVPVQALPLPLFPPVIVGGSLGGSPKPKDNDFVYPSPAQTGGGQVANDNATTDAHAANDNNPKVCPDPSYERDSVGRTAEQLRYQAQINGLQLGYEVVLNNVGYDGCRLSDGVLLEAKYVTPWFLTLSANTIRTLKEYKETVAQAAAQNAFSGGRRVEWHFSDPSVASYWRLEFRRLGFAKIDVKYTAYDELY